jgi:hypothetical protein
MPAALVRFTTALLLVLVEVCAQSQSPTQTPTISSTRSQTQTKTRSQTQSQTQTRSPTGSRTQTASSTGTLTQSRTNTQTVTTGLTPTATQTPSPTQAATPGPPPCSWSPQGCFNDPSPLAPVIPYLLGVASSLNDCQDAAALRGLNTAGVVNGGECRGGSNSPYRSVQRVPSVTVSASGTASFICIAS